MNHQYTHNMTPYEQENGTDASRTSDPIQPLSRRKKPRRPTTSDQQRLLAEEKALYESSYEEAKIAANEEGWRLAWDIICSVTGSVALASACMEPHRENVMKLRSGDEIAFGSAEIINSEWIQIDSITKDQSGRIIHRNLDVRLSDIVWVSGDPGSYEDGDS